MTDDEQAPVEQPRQQAGDAVEEPVGDPAPGRPEPAPRTGVPDVDAVLDDVEALEGRPPAEHVAVFEDAHERLRRALEGTGGLDRATGDA